MEYKHGMICPACTKGKLFITLDPLEFDYKGHIQVFEGYESFKCDLCIESFLSGGFSSEIEVILKVIREVIDGKPEDAPKIILTITRMETDDVKPS
jgi:YgiT-type zinc finger domain-containing protein